MTLHDDTGVRREPPNRTGTIIFLVAASVVAIVAVVWAAGLFTVETDGKLAAPEVSVRGGSVPDVDVNTANVEVGTRTEVIEVPTVEVTPPADK